MNCTAVRAQLDDFVDDTLSPADRSAIEAHLSTCASCRAEVEELRRLIAAAAALPRSITPPAEAWTTVARGIGGRSTAARGVRRFRRSWLAVAAVLVAMVSFGLTAWWRTRARSTPVVTTHPAVQLASYRAVEHQYADAVADLEKTFETHRAQLSPETVAVVERSLHAIDRAIDEARRALAADSASQGLGDLLSSAYRAKIDLLQRATRL